MAVELAKKNIKRYRLSKSVYLILLTLPALIYFAVFRYGPMYGIIMAFQKYMFIKGVWGSPWIGLENFTTFLTGSAFPNVLKNTLIFSSLNMLLGYPIPLILALLLNEMYNQKLKKSIQTISYLPYFVSWVVLAGIIMELLSPTRGVVNYVIQQFGGKPIFFLAEEAWFRPVVLASYIWQQAGWNSVIYLAAIAGVDPELYESAITDGAGRFMRIWHITIPSILPILFITFLFTIAYIMYAPFDPIFNLTNPLVFKVADIFDTYALRLGIYQMNYGFAASVGVFRNVIGLLMIAAAHLVSKRIYGHGLW